MSARKDLPVWTVRRIKGAKSEFVAVVTAKDEASAITMVVKDKGLTNKIEIGRLIARPA